MDRAGRCLAALAVRPLRDPRDGPRRGHDGKPGAGSAPDWPPGRPRAGTRRRAGSQVVRRKHRLAAVAVRAVRAAGLRPGRDRLSLPTPRRRRRVCPPPRACARRRSRGRRRDSTETRRSSSTRCDPRRTEPFKPPRGPRLHWSSRVSARASLTPSRSARGTSSRYGQASASNVVTPTAPPGAADDHDDDAHHHDGADHDDPDAHDDDTYDHHARPTAADDDTADHDDRAQGQAEGALLRAECPRPEPRHRQGARPSPPLQPRAGEEAGLVEADARPGGRTRPPALDQCEPTERG